MTSSRLLREYIDIINETQAQNYQGMFDQLLKLPFSGPDEAKWLNQEIQEEITWARKALKTNPRVVWWLRWYRLGILRKYIDLFQPQVNYQRPFLNLFNRYVIEARPQGLVKPQEADLVTKNILNFHRHLEHYFSLPIEPLQDFNLGWGTPIEICAIFKDLEKEWQVSRNQHIPHDPTDGKVIIQFPDAFAWVDLERPSCEQEADAMGHCGNGAAGQEGETILSLRKLITVGKQKYWHPFLTFILDKNGYLGEMKGRNNDKPVPRYHPYIIKLLESDIVRGIKGGGYAPERNFKMSDLPPDVADQLYEKKPELATVAFLYKKHGMSEELAKRIRMILKARNLGYVGFSPDFTEFRIERFNEWQNIIETYGSTTAKSIVEQLSDFVDTYQGYDEDSAKSLFGDLPHQSIMLIGQFIANDFEKEIADWQEATDEEFDPEDEDSIYQFIEWSDDELMDGLKRAANHGCRVGIENAMIKAIESSLNDGSEIETGTYDFTIHITYDNLKDTFAYDTKCWLAMPLRDIIELVSNDTALDEIENEGYWNFKEFDASEPYYGWSEYDEKAAIEDFYETFPDFAPKRATVPIS